MDYLILWLILSGLLSGFVGAMLGSNSLVSVPLLTLFGIPPHLSIATSQAGAFGMQVGSFFKFKKTSKIIWKHVFWLSLLTLFGIILGMVTVLKIDEQSLKKIIGFLIIISLPFVFTKKSFGTVSKKTSKKMRVTGYLLAAVTSFLGAFGSGAGLLFAFVSIYFLGMTMTQYAATNKIPGMFNSSVAIIVFALAGYFNFLYAVIFFVTNSIGGYFAAHFTIKIGDIWLKRILALFVLFMSIKLIFFS